MARRTVAVEAAPAPPPPPAEDLGIVDTVLDAIRAAKPDFPDQRKGESDQNFFVRLVRACAPSDDPQAPAPLVSDEAWNDLPDHVQDWLNDAIQAMSEKNDIPVPPDEADEPEPEPESAPVTRGRRAATPAPAPAPEPAPAPARGAGLAAFNARRAAAKAAANGAAAPAAEPAPAPVRGRRGVAAAPAPEPAPAPARGRRGVAAAPAPAPATRGRRAATPAPAAAPERAASVVSVIREYILNNLNASPSDAMKHVQDLGYDPTPSTVAGTVTFTKNTVYSAKKLGHWK